MQFFLDKIHVTLIIVLYLFCILTTHETIININHSNMNETNTTKSTSEKAHARTMCLCSKECNSSPVSASQTFLHMKQIHL